jgi:hypothetical protein
MTGVFSIPYLTACVSSGSATMPRKRIANSTTSRRGGTVGQHQERAEATFQDGSGHWRDGWPGELFPVIVGAVNHFVRMGNKESTGSLSVT